LEKRQPGESSEQRVLTEDAKWVGTENMEANKAECKREICDIQKIFGDSNICLFELKLTLATLLQEQRKYKEAEDLIIEVLKQMNLSYSGLRDEINLPGKKYRAQSGFAGLELKLPLLESEQPALEEIIALARDHIPETLSSIRLLAENYLSVGRLKEAEWLYVQIKSIYERQRGEYHPSTLSVTFYIVTVYVKQNRWAEAEALISWVWGAQKRILGTGHYSTRISMSTMARIYSVQGRTKESEVLGKQLIDICKKLLGDKDPETLRAINELSIEFIHQGKWKEAEERAQEAFKGRKEIFGEHHLDTVNSMNNLASIYQERGLLTQAEAMFRQVIKINEKIK